MCIAYLSHLQARNARASLPNTQSRKSLRHSYAPRTKDVGEDSGQILDLLPPGYVRMGVSRRLCVYAKVSKTQSAGPFVLIGTSMF